MSVRYIINTKNCSLSRVLTATDQKPQKSHPLTDQQKFVSVGDPCGCVKFGANLSMGGFWANR